MNPNQIAFLNQLINALEEAEPILKKAYETKDIENFEKSKKFISIIENKIIEVINNVCKQFICRN